MNDGNSIVVGLRSIACCRLVVALIESINGTTVLRVVRYLLACGGRWNFGGDDISMSHPRPRKISFSDGGEDDI